MNPQISYVHGASDIPLLGETIGENLRKTVEKFPNHDALICAHQEYKATYQASFESADCLRSEIGRPCRNLVAQLLPVGAAAICHRENRCDYGEH